MEYVVYCDESRHDSHAQHRYMAIGGLWVPRDLKPELTRRFRRLCTSVGLGSEIKWSKVSAARLEGYKRLIDFFMAEPLNFRVIVVDQSQLDIDKYHGGDRELGFYKFYYEMLEKWIEQGNQYLILLDFKQNKGADRYTTLRTILERKTRGLAWITDLTVIESRQTPLAQLCDLLTGAVAASWCREWADDRPKPALARYLAERLGRRSLRFSSGSPAVEKFNIFAIELS